ncbi:NAD-dependent epimerase/dehydratase family protein [Tessaracoccus antarcticus]|uniref:NAD-dependent epimerase/dehydratase family protein n=1 Tax=Tessaracoccus antarcticus TaxID=2479848 RepID=A0A3M0G904_9ACTN|nr:NAD-dependent epimerase/dehydratase family protein [Tessaracoccus antarcticus]RMB58912.1 NAD-dependent epimerase/dehydratase family protein [Tessaracoccus antarcticus]
MNITVIGGTGHIGTYLVPSLVRDGHAVTVVSRGRRTPYTQDDAWSSVTMVACDREQAEADGVFGRLISQQEPDGVIDLRVFTTQQAHQLIDSLDGQHLVATGSIWSWGRTSVVPMTEDVQKEPLTAYDRGKAAVEDVLLREQSRVTASMVHPSHISGPGWAAVNPAGYFDLDVYRSLKRDGSARLPLDGMALLQHVHAADVAEVHRLALMNPGASAGEAFNVVAEQSITLRAYATLLARHFGHEPQLTFLPWADFVAEVGDSNAVMTHDHITRSPHFSMEKTRRILGFSPRYSEEETVLSAVDALADL